MYLPYGCFNLDGFRGREIKPVNEVYACQKRGVNKRQGLSIEETEEKDLLPVLLFSKQPKQSS